MCVGCGEMCEYLDVFVCVVVWIVGWSCYGRGLIESVWIVLVYDVYFFEFNFFCCV